MSLFEHSTKYQQSFISLFYLILGLLIGIFAQSLWNGFIFFSMRMKGTESAKTILYPEKPPQVPRHIAVIMDGNRRFGRRKHADPLQGHWAGGQTLIDFVQWCMNDGVEMLTVYAFSTENWNRDPYEVTTLMTIFSKYADSFKTEALSRNVRVRVLSTDFNLLPLQVQHAVRELESSTSACTGFLLNICLSYGGRAEILSACSSMVAEIVSRNSGNSSSSEATSFSNVLVTEEDFSRHLCTKDIPEPDILIRTSGEYRLSNFLLWQLAYSELFFVDKLWPEMTRDDLRQVMFQFLDRQRRYGK